MNFLGEVKIDVIWTDSISSKAINDFIKVHKQVFSSNYNECRFHRKFTKNIYGPSIIVLAYIENECVGTRAFWRNDINGLKAYQPCDTAVLRDYRRCGIFTKMNYAALDAVVQDELIYNFPNDSSLPGYLKMGWTFCSRKRYKLYNPFKDYKEVDKIENDYLNWLLTDSENNFNKYLYYTHISGYYFLIKRRKYNLYVIIAELEKSQILYFKKAKFTICLHYSLKGYFGRGLVTITRNCDGNIDIPLYKVDTIF